jgi:hypothetical protein
MKKLFLLNRLTRLYKTYGFGELIKRVLIRIWHSIYTKPDVIYFADLPLLSSEVRLKEMCRVVERRSCDSMEHCELDSLCNYIGRSIAMYQLKERFSKGASIWLLKKGDECLGMVWTIMGDTIEPFYYFMGKKDVHFFNNEIFITYRGQGFNSGLIEYVLIIMKERGCVRAYIETNKRNVREQRSLKKTSFRIVGLAKKTNWFGKHLTVWGNNNFLVDMK